MSKAARNEYAPDTVAPPGDTLLEAIENIGMSQAELAERTGRPKKTINEIINGKAAITSDTALQLERVLGVPARFWLNLDQHYREYLTKHEEQERLGKHLTWLDGFPVREMVKLGWIRSFGDKIEQMQELLSFFGVASPECWQETYCSTQVVYRRSSAFRSEPGAVSAWLRKGELDGQQTTCSTYNEAGFRQALAQLRSMTTESPEVSCPQMQALCAKSGVVVVFVREIPGAPVSGATRWLTSDKALVQLTIRHKSDDHLWFTFFHEAGHILLHGKRDVFIEDDKVEDPKEAEADRFASDLLIPPSELLQFTSAGRITAESIQGFASRIGIAPGIVVGRLQHDGLVPYSRHNHLKRRLQWKCS